MFINDTEEVYHWGCYGTSRAIKDQLIKKGVTNVDPISVYQTRSMENIPKSIADFKNKEYFKCIHPDLAKRLERCHAVVINGEGTIHGFRNAPRTLLYLAYVSKNFFGKKVFLINHSCYPTSWRPQVIDFYKIGYSSCDFIAARESRSTKTIKERLGQDCVEAFDSLPLTIRKVYDQIPGPIISQPYICISGAVNYKTGRSASIARQLLRSYPDHKFIYLVGSKEEGINQEEPRVYESLQKFLPSLQLVDAKSFTEWLSIIKYAELLLSGRFHYTIAALCFGTRAIYFRSNTPKIDSIAIDLGLPTAIPRRPAILFEFMLWRRIKQMKTITWPNQLDYLCHLAEKNYDWDI